MSRVGIGGLPAELDHFLPRRLYGVTTSHARLMLLYSAGSAAAALREGRSVTAVIGVPPADWLETLRGLGIDGEVELRRGRLHLYEASAEWERVLVELGGERLADELDHFGVMRGAHLIVVPADLALCWKDPSLAVKQARAYRQWCETRETSGLLVMSPAVPPAGALVALRGLADSFAGIAHFRGDGANFHWAVEHWRGLTTTVVDQTFPIGFDGRGVPAVLPETGATGDDSRGAPDEGQVFATPEAVDDAGAVPQGWEVPADIAKALQQAVAATCVLGQGDRELREVARQVYEIRTHGGKALKIVVRVRGQRLRYNDELMLLRLGANIVVPSAAGFGALMTRLPPLRGKLYTRDLAADFDEAVLAAAPPAAGGYQAPSLFSSVAAETLARAEAIGLQNAMVRLHLIQNVPHLDALRACRLKRPGDLVSADDSSLYLFLFACRESDIDATVDRVFGVPVAELFEGQTRYASSDVIRGALDELALRLRAAPMADFSSQLGVTAVAAAAAGDGATAPGAVAAVANKPYVPAGRARTVVRVPLPLKGVLA